MALFRNLLSVVVLIVALLFANIIRSNYEPLATCQVQSAARMEGRTVLITGANSGVGLASAVDLAKRGARVLMACRDEQRCKAAAADVRRLSHQPLESNPMAVSTLTLDLASFASVRAAAKRVLAEESRLDVLMNNAGLLQKEFLLTVDGLETTWQVNHVGHFLLTKLLLPLLKRSQPSRIITVSSVAHKKQPNLRWDDITLNRKDNYSMGHAYAQSKLANVLFASELAWRLRNDKYQITSNSLCPGFVSTSIYRYQPSWIATLVNFLEGSLSKTAEQGAQTQIRLAVDTLLSSVTGDYFNACERILPSEEARKLGNAQLLWQLTERQLGEKFNI